MYPYDKDGLFRRTSKWLLFKPLLRTQLSANQITVLNFLITGCGAVALFLLGGELEGLLLLILGGCIDYLDGEIARFRGTASKLGGWLDTGLDWLLLIMLVGAIGYSTRQMNIAYVALVAITYGNWVSYSAKVEFELPLILNTGFLIIVGVIFRALPYVLWLIMSGQVIRTTILYRRAVCNMSRVSP